jgi:hypothetical protein
MAEEATRIGRRDEGESPVACNDLNGKQRQPNQRQFCPGMSVTEEATIKFEGPDTFVATAKSEPGVPAGRQTTYPGFGRSAAARLPLERRPLTRLSNVRSGSVVAQTSFSDSGF